MGLLGPTGLQGEASESGADKVEEMAHIEESVDKADVAWVEDNTD